MNLPPAIIYVNYDISDIAKTNIISQLYITETITFEEFAARVNADPNYPTNIHLHNLRVLVLLSNFADTTLRNIADVVIFVKSGMASILQDNYGPPSLTLPLESLYIHKLLRYNNSQYTTNLPMPPSYPYSHQHNLGGIFALQSTDTSGVRAPNIDNELNNPDFINRK